MLPTKGTVNLSGWLHGGCDLRVGLSRAGLAVSEEAGVVALEGSLQEWRCQRLVHGCLAGIARVRIVEGPKRDVVDKSVSLFHLGMLHRYFFPAPEDNLGRFLQLLSLKRSTQSTPLMIVSTISAERKQGPSKLKAIIPSGLA